MAGTILASLKTWSGSITLAAAERWQVRSGSVLLTFGASAPAGVSSSEGLQYKSGETISIPNGAVVRHRATGGGNATIAREVVA